jgi:hypothetical protein
LNPTLRTLRIRGRVPRPISESATITLRENGSAVNIKTSQERIFEMLRMSIEETSVKPDDYVSWMAFVKTNFYIEMGIHDTVIITRIH